MNKIIISALAMTLCANAYAQKSDGTTKSLVEAEKEFAASVKKEGTSAAFSKFAAQDGIVFRPNPVNAKKHFAIAKDISGLSWDPVIARVSRSGDWGFTLGNYTVAEGSKATYGHYLTVWRATDGKWEYIIDIGADAVKPFDKKTLKSFVEPKDSYRPKFASAKELKASVDIIYATEKTLNTTLKAMGPQAFAGFLNHDAVLQFPGTETITGKNDILAFNNRVMDKISLKTVQADKALGGDYAYTYGVATIDYKADLRESFNYVFIWQRQSDATWNIIAQIFNEAVR
ncbi:nuclear transport factor 2 family protein [Pedobacter montanisoli]|uniref:Nuclear transport factor 2 family protein n=1 Tax=Pedobacter montanisoli TaxID=2923277 RepID=A0ABS9ZRW7_9SPHI|nr:nuclear transport factor 2 family protein [Pedobacter montanisoli]MCJ0741332.1 nuclear transport factor 2 family protein [Pedobacter montanisoli]